MTLPLVTIITPCFNGEKHIYRLLESLIKQTYSNIEFILVDDGSTDRTREIVNSYREKFKENNIVLNYIYQENKGVGGAIVTGLKETKGDYICWPDSDDYLEPDSIKKRVEILEKYQEYDTVTSDAYVRDINNLENYKVLAASKQKNKFEDYQFDFLIEGNSMMIPGCHMVRAEIFFKVQPKSLIYPHPKGQNWQLLMPMYYKRKRYFLNEPLYNYIIYDQSMSQGDNTEEKKLKRSADHRDIILTTLNSMFMDDAYKESYRRKVNAIYLKKDLTIGFLHHNKILVRKNYLLLKDNKSASIKDSLYYFAIHNYFLYKLCIFARAAIMLLKKYLTK